MTDPSPTGRGIPSLRVAALAGCAALTFMLGGILAARLQHPGYSALKNYVSELALPVNPGRWWFALALIGGGLAIVPLAGGFARLVPNRQGLIAARLGQLAGAFMVLVGIFPVQQPTPHFACAFVLFAAAVFATLYMGLGLRAAAAAAGVDDPAAAAGRRRIATVLFVMFATQLIMTVADFVQTALAMRHLTSRTPDAILKELPKLQMVTPWPGGPVLNPPAIMEWVFFVSASILIAAASLAAWRAPRESS